jgi:hypothetical protein|nr:MAG TPA: hypothetical protein [Caudoviricetes sp.]
MKNEKLRLVLLAYNECDVMVFSHSEKMLFKGNGQDLLSMLGAGYYADKRVKEIFGYQDENGIITSVDIILK